MHIYTLDQPTAAFLPLTDLLQDAHVQVPYSNETVLVLLKMAGVLNFHEEEEE